MGKPVSTQRRSVIIFILGIPFVFVDQIDQGMDDLAEVAYNVEHEDAKVDFHEALVGEEIVMIPTHSPEKSFELDERE